MIHRIAEDTLKRHLCRRDQKQHRPGNRQGVQSAEVYRRTRYRGYSQCRVLPGRFEHEGGGHAIHRLEGLGRFPKITCQRKTETGDGSLPPVLISAVLSLFLV